MKQGWEKMKLGEVCDFISRGVSPKYIESAGLMVLNQKCIRNHVINYSLGKFHDKNTKPISNERLVQVGDVLVNSTGTGTLGRVAQVVDKVTSTVDSHITIVRPRKDIFYLPFFGKAMISIEKEIAKGGEGCGGQTELSRNKLKDEYYVTFPKSLPEQKRIVAILDEAFAAIEKAKANAEKNLRNAKELFESYLNGVFDPSTRSGQGTGEDWEEKLLDDVCDLITCGVAARPEYVENGVPFLSAKNVKDGKVVWSGYNYVSSKTHKDLTKNNKPLKGDLLYTRVGSFGEAAVIEDEIEFSIFVSLTLIKVDTKALNNYFLKYYLNSPIIKKLAKASISGTGVGNLNVGSVRKFPISLPSLEVQLNIIKKLDALKEESQKLESIYQSKINDLDELKKSILQKAFSGELTSAKSLAV